MKHPILLATLTLATLACDTAPAPTKEPMPQAQPVQHPAAATAVVATPANAPALPVAKGPFPPSNDPAMLDPSKAAEQAPEQYRVTFDTTVGAFSVGCERAWAPNGVDRFYNLVKIGFFDDVAFFRAVPGFVVQFGIHGDPNVSRVWRDANIAPDEVKTSNKRGYLTFAMAGRPDTRSTQLFFNFGDNSRLDKMGFAAVCLVEGEGMKTVDKIYQGYGEKAGRDQASIQSKGNAYLRQNYPQLDYIKTARLADGEAPKPTGDDQSADVEASATPSATAAAPKVAAPKAAAPKAEKAAPLAETKETGGGTGKGKGKGKGDGSGQGDGSGKGSQGD
jgi:peptidyl-prolyl cis-trans isomerase A (cyclophilin A)